MRLRSRLALVSASVLAAVGSFVLVAPTPAFADTTLCSTYEGCLARNLTTWQYDQRNRTSYWTMTPGHNCTNYVAYVMRQRGVLDPPSNLGNANYWGSRARQQGLTVDSAPVTGAVAWWDRNSGGKGYDGHVAVVEAVRSDGILVSEDSYGGTFDWKFIPRGARWPSGFIHFERRYTFPTTFRGDWDGNGTETPAVVRRLSDGTLQWHLRNSNSAGAAATVFTYGSTGDIPVVGNWDGVGGDTIGIVRRTGGVLQWHLRNYNSPGAAQYIFGYGNDTTDYPVVGDWDGNGISTVGIARRVDGALQWHLRNANSAGPASYVFGYGNATTDMPVVGDWNGNRTTTIGITRRVSGQLQWHLRNANSAGAASTIFGYGNDSTDVPVTGNWDGVGGDTPGIVRVNSGVLEWHLRNYNAAGSANYIFGYGGNGEVTFAF